MGAFWLQLVFKWIGCNQISLISLFARNWSQLTMFHTVIVANSLLSW